MTTLATLLEGKTPPVTVQRQDPLDVALTTMVAHDYHQLPVVEDGKLLGLVTLASAARVLLQLRTSPDGLRVLDAVIRPATLNADDELDLLLQSLGESDAVLVLAAPDGALVGILTTDDTTRYFRAQTEDILLVRDIETGLREIVLASFRDPAGQVDDAALAHLLPADPASPRRFRGAIDQAMAAAVAASGGTALPGGQLDGLFQQYVVGEEAPRDFNTVDLGELLAVFLNKGRWEEHFQPIFGPQRESIGEMLDQVRVARNQLAHFRGDLSADQREKIHFAADWLARHRA